MLRAKFWPMTAKPYNPISEDIMCGVRYSREDEGIVLVSFHLHHSLKVRSNEKIRTDSYPIYFRKLGSNFHTVAFVSWRCFRLVVEGAASMRGSSSLQGLAQKQRQQAAQWPSSSNSPGSVSQDCSAPHPHHFRCPVPSCGGSVVQFGSTKPFLAVPVHGQRAHCTNDRCPAKYTTRCRQCRQKIALPAGVLSRECCGTRLYATPSVAQFCAAQGEFAIDQCPGTFAARHGAAEQLHLHYVGDFGVSSCSEQRQIRNASRMGGASHPAAFEQHHAVGHSFRVLNVGGSCANLRCRNSWCTVGVKDGIEWAKCQSGHQYKWCAQCNKAVVAKSWSTSSTHNPGCSFLQKRGIRASLQAKVRSINNKIKSVENNVKGLSKGKRAITTQRRDHFEGHSPPQRISCSMSTQQEDPEAALGAMMEGIHVQEPARQAALAVNTDSLSIAQQIQLLAQPEPDSSLLAQPHSPLLAQAAEGQDLAQQIALLSQPVPAQSLSRTSSNNSMMNDTESFADTDSDLAYDSNSSSDEEELNHTSDESDDECDELRRSSENMSISGIRRRQAQQQAESNPFAEPHSPTIGKLSPDVLNDGQQGSINISAESKARGISANRCSNPARKWEPAIAVDTDAASAPLLDFLRTEVLEQMNLPPQKKQKLLSLVAAVQQDKQPPQPSVQTGPAFQAQAPPVLPSTGGEM